MPRAYYNEHDPFAAAWLRRLIAAGLIADGEVDERDVRDVRPSDVAGFTQCHFFAGIGAWSYALRLAGWPDDRPVWTGSCPCQPFSEAGRRDGFDDERHLWPAWHHLIWHNRPGVVFGEQVASTDGWTWLDLVHADMEGTGYALGPAVLPAASIGAPHPRHRLWFVADTQSGGRGGPRQHGPRPGHLALELAGQGAAGALADTYRAQRPRRERDGDARGRGRFADGGSLGDAHAQGSPHAEPDGVEGSRWWSEGGAVEQPGRSFWTAAQWHLCRDSRYRAIEPGVFPVAYGATERVGRLRCYGNAIVPWVAAEFIAAYLEARGEPAVTLAEMLE